MKLPKFAIENHQFATILILLLTLMGLVAFLTMPRSEDPAVSPAGSSIIVVYPGATPADVEELIVDPIEEVLNELEDIKEIKANAGDGLGTINIEFLSGSDPEEKYSDVVQKVNSIKNSLPNEIVKLDMIKWSISDVNIIQVALISETASYRSLEKEAERLKDSFDNVIGIKKVQIRAFPEQEIRISVDLEKTAQMNIPMNQIIGSIQMNNTNIPGGYIDLGSKRFNLQTSGSFKNIDEIKNVVVNAMNGNIVYLKDIAEVKYDNEDEKYLARFNGKRALFIIANQKVGTNIFDVRDQLEDKLNRFEAELPEEIDVDIAFDQSESVATRLEGFFLNLLQGLLLVGIIVIIAVGFRASIIVMLAIPTSIFIGIGFIDLSGYGLQQMTIAGLVIALGLLVDNAIVVTENITRYMKLGMTRSEAAVKGVSEIAWAIVSSTATTVLAFVPMMMMQNITGDFIRSMPLTVIYTLTASLVVSLMLTPYLSKKFIKINGKGDSRFRKLLNKQIETSYRKTLSFALKKPAIIFLAVGIVFIGSMSLFPLIGVAFFPKAEKPQFIININTPNGSSLDKTDRVAKYVESVLKAREEITHFATNVGRGNPRIYYNVMSKHETATHAQILVQLDEYNYKPFNKLLEDLRSEFSRYAGAKIEVKDFEQGPPIEAPVAIKIIGDNLDILEEISGDVEKMFLSTEGTINVNNPLSTSKTDLQIKINREKAGLLGVPIAEIDKTVRAAITGLTISKYRDSEGKEYNIVIRLPINKKPALKDLDRIYISSVTGAQVPLKQLASIELKATPMNISHYDLDRTVMLTADVIANYSVDKVTKEIISDMDNYHWPKGYSYHIAGEMEKREESFGGMMQAIIIAIVGIFAVLVLQFRSYSQPLIVFSAIPLAFIGSFIALFITGFQFSFTAFVGLTSLVGIVVNNSIILVDYTNQLRAEGKEMIAALKEAGETRFIPIVLTTATTVGGLLPLTLGGGTMWAPMGWAIIGGLLFSTFLTLVVVPVLYKVYTK